MDPKLQITIATHNGFLSETEQIRRASKISSPTLKTDYELAFAEQLAYILTVSKGNIAAVSIIRDEVFWTRNYPEASPKANEELGERLLSFCQDFARSKPGIARKQATAIYRYKFLKLAVERIKNQIERHWTAASTFAEENVTPATQQLWSDLRVKHEELVQFWRLPKAERGNLNARRHFKYFFIPFLDMALDFFLVVSKRVQDIESNFELTSLKKLSLYWATLFEVSACCFKAKYKEQITSIRKITYIPPTTYPPVKKLGNSIKLLRPLVHAELNLLNALLYYHNPPSKIRVGVGKNVCWLCAKALEAYPLKKHVVIRPSDDNLYVGWCAPAFLTAEDRLNITALVQEKSDDLQTRMETSSDGSRPGEGSDSEAMKDHRAEVVLTDEADDDKAFEYASD